MNLLIIGYAQHGKDDLADFLCDIDTSMSKQSSSDLALDIFIFDALKDKYGYSSKEECYADRMNHRAEWFDLIAEYNDDDPARLAKKLLEISNIYVGMRRRAELIACKAQRLFDAVIWVDASKRKPPEGSDSMELTQEDADFIVDNNGSLSDLRSNAESLLKMLGSKDDLGGAFWNVVV